MIPTHVCYRAQPHQLCLFASLAHITPGEKNKNWPSAVQALVAKGSAMLIRFENLIWFDPCCISTGRSPVWCPQMSSDVLRCPQMSSGHTWEHLCCTFSLSLWGRKQRNCSDSEVREVSTEASPVLHVSKDGLCQANWNPMSWDSVQLRLWLVDIAQGPTAPAMSQMPILIPTLIGNSPLVPVVLHKSIFGRHVMIHDNQEMIENVWKCVYLLILIDCSMWRNSFALKQSFLARHPRAKRLVVNGCKASSWSRSSEGPADRFQTRDSTKHETRWGLLLYLLYLYLSYLVSHTSSQAIWNDSAVVVL